MRLCPFQGCSNRVAGANFCCTRHWHTLAREYRDRAFDCYRRFANGQIKLEELISEQFQIADESEFGSTATTGGSLYVSCPQCRCTCFRALFGGGSVLLDSNHCGLTGEFVVVRGVAYSGEEARAKLQFAPGLALLRVHQCASGSRCQGQKPSKMESSNGGIIPSYHSIERHAG